MHSIYLPIDVIERLRRRPRVIFTDAKNVRDVFLYNARLKLFILLIIGDYNHHMNGVDVANQRRKHLIKQRKHNLRNWRPLFHWLLDVTLTNYFILWRMQARKQDFKANWDPVEFNKAIKDSLLTYDLITHTSEQVLTRKNAVIQREIPAERIRKSLLLDISKKVGEVTNVDSIVYARAYILERVDRSQRRECIGCKIKGLLLRPEGSVRVGAGRRVLADITNKKANKEVKYARKAQGKCAQCNVSLCIYGECWDVYHRAKKFS